MEDYKTRSKINSKIIFNEVSEKTKNALVIGNNNMDLIEVLKLKKISTTEFNETNEKELINFLSNLEENKFELIILNYELSNFYNIKCIIDKIVEKSNYSVIRFRNNNHNGKQTKKKLINRILKKENINIFKKVYGKMNTISSCILFKPFAYYSVYFISKDKYATNTILSPINKIKSYLKSIGKKMVFTFETNKR